MGSSAGGLCPILNICVNARAGGGLGQALGASHIAQDSGTTVEALEPEGGCLVWTSLSGKFLLR